MGPARRAGTDEEPERIEALFCCQYIALLCCCLIERELHNAMTREQINDLPLYPEQRACVQPTADRPPELFAGLVSRVKLLCTLVS